jgi:hypothetical protein
LANFLHGGVVRRVQYRDDLAPYDAQMTQRLLVLVAQFERCECQQDRAQKNYSLIAARDRRKNCHLIIVVDWCVGFGDLSIYPDTACAKYTLEICTKPSHCLRNDL